MTRQWRRASLLLIPFSLLASAATANAECAWVLWSIINPGDEPSLMRVIPIRGFNALGACESFQTSKSVEAEMKVMRAVGHIVCLPDTVDPRGPKGK